MVHVGVIVFGIWIFPNLDVVERFDDELSRKGAEMPVPEIPASRLITRPER